MKELVEFLARQLVNHPDDVVVSEKREGSRIYLTLSVNEADVGKVIGRGGKIAKAMRSVLKAAATKENVKATLEIL